MLLWQHMSNKQYGAVIDLIKSEPELVNSQDKEGYSLLMVALEAKEKPLDLVKLILQHKQFNLSYKNTETDETNMDAIIATANLEILKMAAHNHSPEYLINGTQLTYQSVQKRLNAAKGTFEKRKVKDPNDPSNSNIKTRIEALEKMAAYMRDATILHAIDTDNAQLFDRLEQAGANPSDTLSNGTPPQSLLTAKNHQLFKWFDRSFEDSIKQLSGKQTKTRPSPAREELPRYEQSVQALKERHLKNQMKIMETVPGKRGDAMDRVVTTMQSSTFNL